VLTWRSFKQTSSLQDMMRQEASSLRQKAQKLAPSIRRDHLIRQARQAETAAKINEWLRSPGLQPPR
jgi:hypothetical protein